MGCSKGAKKAATVEVSQAPHGDGNKHRDKIPSDIIAEQGRLFELPPADADFTPEGAIWRENADMWKADHPTAYARFCEILHESACVRHCRASAAFAAGMLQYEGFCDNEGEPLKVNHNIIPFLSRDFIDGNPGAERFVKTRRSRADRFKGGSACPN